MIARVGVTLAAAAAAITGFAVSAPASVDEPTGQEAACPAGTVPSRVESLLSVDAVGEAATPEIAVEEVYAGDNALDQIPADVEVLATEGNEAVADVLDAAGDPIGRVELEQLPDDTWTVATILACRQEAS